MKIHYLVTSLETGGAEFAIPDVVKAIERLGHTVTIVACEPRDLGAVPRLKAAGLDYLLLENRRRSTFVVLNSYRRLLRSDRPDVIWTSLSWGTRIGQLAGFLTGIPVISFKHSASVKPVTYHMRHLSRLWVGDSRTVVNYLHDQMKIAQERIVALPLYICAPDAPTASRWQSGSVLQLGSVGRLHEVKQYEKLIKGLGLFLKTYPEHSDKIHLTIMGEGPERERLEACVREAQVQEHVSLPGHSEDVSTFLSRLNVYAQTSRYEGMCLAAHEAMNAGLAVMTTPVGELNYSIRDNETGFILADDIPRSLCLTLKKIFDHPELLEHYGTAARAYVQRTYSRQAFEESVAEVISRISQDVHLDGALQLPHDPYA